MLYILALCICLFAGDTRTDNYARKLTGNDDFCFDSLPEEILVMISECDNNDKKHRWSYFIKMHVRKKLQELDFNV